MSIFTITQVSKVYHRSLFVEPISRFPVSVTFQCFLCETALTYAHRCLQLKDIMSFSAATATPTERATAALLLLMLFSSSTTNAYSDKGSTHQGHARAQEKIRDITSRHLPLKTRNCEPCGAPRRVYKSSNDPVGRKHEFRIVGGRKSMQSRPWMVFVLILRDNRCSGSLLNERLQQTGGYRHPRLCIYLCRYVLTAAHCVCTHFFCGTDDNGRRISNFKPRTDIRVRFLYPTTNVHPTTY